MSADNDDRGPIFGSVNLNSRADGFDFDWWIRRRAEAQEAATRAAAGGDPNSEAGSGADDDTGTGLRSRFRRLVRRGRIGTDVQ